MRKMRVNLICAKLFIFFRGARKLGYEITKILKMISFRCHAEWPPLLERSRKAPGKLYFKSVFMEAFYGVFYYKSCPSFIINPCS